jgi:putative photosynthetic complex assembly protein
MADTPRIHADTDRMVPVAMVRAMFALVALILAMVSYAVWSGRPLESTPPVSPVKREAMFYLSSDISGSATVLDSTGTLIADLGPEQGGFISGVHRVIVFERRKAGLAEDGPVIVQAYENGRMAIIDPTTGWSADLMGFGADNAAAFAKLLAAN